MKKYEVIIIETYHIVVEAENEDQAREVAEYKLKFGEKPKLIEIHSEASEVE